MSRFHAHGTVIEFASATIGRLTGITAPDKSKGQVQITDGESAGDHEYLPGLREGGSMTLEWLIDVEDVGQTAVRTNYDATPGDIETIFITYPAAAHSTANAVTIRFQGFIADMPEGDFPQDTDDPATGGCTIKVTSAVTRTIAP